MKTILHIGRAAAKFEYLFVVRLVFREKQLGSPGGQQPPLPVLPVLQLRAQRTRCIGSPSRRWPPQIFSPRPSVTKPQRWQQVQWSSLWPAIERSDFDKDVFYIGFRVFHEHVEIPVLLKDARIQQLKLGVRSPALCAFLRQPAIRKLRLRA